MPSGKFGRSNVRSAKLTPTKVLEIRSKYSLDMKSQGNLAREYGVSVGTIGRIVRGETWQNFQQVESDREIEDRMVMTQIRAARASPPSPEEIAASQKRLMGLLGEAAPPDLMKAVRAEAAKDEADAKEERASEAQARETMDKELDEFTQKGDSQ